MATFTTKLVDASYQYITSLAQSKNTGQYMLAITTGPPIPSNRTGDFKGRIFKSDDYGANWTLLQDLFPIPINGPTNSSHLNYAALEAEVYQPEPNARYNSCIFWYCAVSDDGKYQMVGQVPGNIGIRGMWYSTNYGNQTPGGPADENWKYILQGTSMNGSVLPPVGTFYTRYSPGAYPAATSLTDTFTHFTGLTPATGIFNSLGNMTGTYHTYALPALYDNNFTTISRKVIYYIGSGNLYKNTTGTGTGTLINPLGWPVSTESGGGVAVSPDSNIVVAARYANSTGGLWLSNDGGSTWTKKPVNGISNINLNAVDMSHDGKYIVTSAIGQGNLTFYLSQNSGETWTSNPNNVSITGNLLRLDITNDGKRVVGAAMKSANPTYDQPRTVGYFNYIGPLTAAEQRATGKTIAELLALSYSINDIRSAGYSANELIAAGITPNWDYYTTANRINKSYVNNFVDLSGDMIIRNNGAIIGGGDISFNNITVASSTTFAGDTTLKSRLFIGNDISVNGNLYVGGDLSVNGIFSGNFANNVIPPSAIINYPSSGSNVEITGNVRVAGDASFNGTRVDLSTNTILQVSGNITFTDGTTLSTYVDDISSGTFAQGNVIFKAATFAAVTCTGTARAGSTVTSSDYRIKTNVTDLDDSYSVDKLEPIQYDNILSNKHEFGLIAHELQAVYPELVKGEKDGAEYQRVNYNGLIGVLVKKVQELKRRKEVLCEK